MIQESWLDDITVLLVLSFDGASLLDASWSIGGVLQIDIGWRMDMFDTLVLVEVDTDEYNLHYVQPQRIMYATITIIL